MSEPVVYNPLDKANLGASVADALLGGTPRALSDLAPFAGAGIYAVYYRGEFEAYQRLALLNSGGDPQAPIYVGKAIPEGARKGTVATEGAASKALFRRLKEHAESIGAVSNLKLDDFTCRYLLVDDIWIPLGESLLIAKFSPIWNTLIDGFGNHDPGKGRYEGTRPKWDVLHPGRVWASRCKPREESAHDIAREVINHLANQPSLSRSRFLAEGRTSNST